MLDVSWEARVAAQVAIVERLLPWQLGQHHYQLLVEILSAHPDDDTDENLGAGLEAVGRRLERLGLEELREANVGLHDAVLEDLPACRCPCVIHERVQRPWSGLVYNSSNSDSRLERGDVGNAHR